MKRLLFWIWGDPSTPWREEGHITPRSGGVARNAQRAPRGTVGLTMRGPGNTAIKIDFPVVKPPPPVGTTGLF